MTNLDKLELAVEPLPEAEYSLFRQWFMERDWEKWDRQFEDDSASGKLDFLIQEARNAQQSGSIGEAGLSHN